MRQNSGQALLIILLSMAVILTVILSIVARSITDITVGSREQEAIRAFSAAEAGVEKALIIGQSASGTIGDATFTTTVTGTSASGKEFSYPVNLYSGESVIIWFTNHDSSGNTVCDSGHTCYTGNSMKLCWGSPGTSGSSSVTPAVEVSVFYDVTPGDGTDVRIGRGAYDPYTARQSSNSFASTDAGSCTIGSDTFSFQKTFNLSDFGIPAGVRTVQNGLQFARVRFFYNTTVGHPVGVSVNFAGNSDLPPQGMKIESTGTAGESNRKVQVYQGYGEIPTIFDSAIYSPGGITK